MDLRFDGFTLGKYFSHELEIANTTSGYIWAQNISSSASDENLNTLPGDLPRPLKFGLCSSIFYGILDLDGCWTTTDVELFAVCLDVLYRGVLNQHLFIVEGRRNKNFVDDAALLRWSLKECMSSRIELNGSTDKFNGSYCQRYELASLLLPRTWTKLGLLWEWVPWIVFCVILHWGFNVKIKWESKNLKFQYFFVFWDWLW